MRRWSRRSRLHGRGLRIIGIDQLTPSVPFFVVQFACQKLSLTPFFLLSPHVDALFDEELLSFEDDGQMLVHPSLSPDVLYRWSIDPAKRVEPFRDEQRVFLSRHRELFAQKVR